MRFSFFIKNSFREKVKISRETINFRELQGEKSFRVAYFLVPSTANFVDLVDVHMYA
jgi:hypothetical protein